MDRIPEIGIAAIVKNEAPYILEWVAFHRAVGIERFFIADNSSDDGTSELLQTLDLLGIIEYLPFPTQAAEAPQLPAYQLLQRLFGKQVDWMEFIDADEFIVPTGPIRSVPRIVAQLVAARKKVGQISVNWACFGSSGETEASNELVIERFRRRGPEKWGVNRHYKGLIRMKAFVGVGTNPHYFRVKPGYDSIHTDGSPLVDSESGKGISQAVIWENMRINHYVIKSFDEFMNRKRKRGRATTRSVRSEGFFKAHDRNDVEDESLDWIVDPVKDQILFLQRLIGEVDPRPESR